MFKGSTSDENWNLETQKSDATRQHPTTAAPFQTFHRYAQFKSFQSLADSRNGNLYFGSLGMRDRRRYLHWVFEAKKRFRLCVLDNAVTSNQLWPRGRSKFKVQVFNVVLKEVKSFKSFNRCAQFKTLCT
jgi:hypothetical protein